MILILEMKVNAYYFLITRRGTSIGRPISRNDDEIESHEKTETTTTIPKVTTVIPTGKSHYDDIYANSHFDDIITKPDIIQNNDINDKKMQFITYKPRWCLIHWVIAGLMFFLMVYFVLLCIKMCSKVPVEKTVEAQNYMKNIVSCKKGSAKDELYANLV